MTSPQHLQPPLLADVRELIDAARQRVAQTVNAELTQLYWQIGRRISTELLHGQRADYGKQETIRQEQGTCRTAAIAPKQHKGCRLPHAATSA